jgi:hypothetical protein
VDTEKASINPQAVGTRCSQFDYHADLSDSFERTSTVEFSRVADDIRPLDHPLSRAELASAGYTGVIALRISDLRADVKVPDLFGGQADASATIAGTITVTLGDQRLVDSSQLARGEAEREAGIACGGAAEALAAASNDAVQDLARKLAEQFANSHAVRNAMTPGLTP